MDRDPAELRAAFDRYCAEGLHLSSLTRDALGSYRFLAQLAERSGALAFLALQQHVASAWLQPGEGARIGVAFGHLRRPDSRAVARNGDGRVSGIVPWFTGSGFFDEAILGFTDPDGAEVRVRIDARDRPSFKHSAPMNLIAMASTQTVLAHVSACVDYDGIDRRPAGSMARDDSAGYVWQTPLMAGIARAACRWVAHRDPEHGRALWNRIEARIATAEAGLAGGPPETDGPRQRARFAGMMHDSVRLAALATGGEALMAGHPVERLYREAVVIDLMARTPAIVTAAFACSQEERP